MVQFRWQRVKDTLVIGEQRWQASSDEDPSTATTFDVTYKADALADPRCGFESAVADDGLMTAR